MKKFAKKLRLGKETLTRTQLGRAGGGITIGGCSQACTQVCSFVCTGEACVTFICESHPC